MFGQYLPGLLTHKAYKWRSIVDVVVFTSEGLYGQPLSIASSYVAAFVLFGSFLSITGAGQWFIDMAFSLTGKYRSGPAMTAVVSSAAMGTISGTGVANVVTTGAFTIPLMKSCGYSPTMAGAVEATASTGGQIMPPVMGAGAFILADMIGVSYGEVAIASILPALLYFLACAFQVDFEAGRLGMTGLPADKLPKRWETFKSGWLYLLPVALLIWALCIKNYSANYSARGDSCDRLRVRHEGRAHGHQEGAPGASGRGTRYAFGRHGVRNGRYYDRRADQDWPWPEVYLPAASGLRRHEAADHGSDHDLLHNPRHGSSHDGCVHHHGDALRARDH